MAYVVKHTDLEGEEYLYGPFKTRATAYTWASNAADKFYAGFNPTVKRQWELDADGRVDRRRPSP